jgi:hypothetical protein
MAQKETVGEQPGNFSLFNRASADFAATAKKRFDEFAKGQTELFETVQEINRRWLERVREEATLASEFSSKLTAARSIPDAMATCQECGARWFETMAEDTKHLLDDTQKFMQMSARILVNGWQSGPGITT